ncbi:MAG: putative DNA-binding domain-containing protein [Acetobacteraceae bacterium]
MTGLHALQRCFRDALLRDAPPPAEILGGAVPAAARLGVYRNNVFGNLTAALRLTYPAVNRLVGEEFFAAAAARFIPEDPPASPDLYEYGAGFAAFLAGYPPAAGLAYLPDIARLEWAVCRAIHADPAPPLDPAALAGREDAVFTMHPTLTLLRTAGPARAIWEAVLGADDATKDAALAAIDPTAPGEDLAVLAPDGMLRVRPLPPPEAALAAALAAGASLSAALAAVPPEDAAAAFAALLAEGLLGGCGPPPEA